MRRNNPDAPDLRLMVQSINQLMEGRNNAVFVQPLDAGTSTTLTDIRINGDGYMFWTPLDSAAAALLPTMYHDAPYVGGTATIVHGNAAGSELFAWICFGG